MIVDRRLTRSGSASRTRSPPGTILYLAADPYGEAHMVNLLYLAYRLDLPLGPTQVALASGLLMAIATGQTLGQMARRR